MKTIQLAIVDDNELVLGGLKSMLAACVDIMVDFATTKPAELLNYLQKAQPDAVLLDIQMPDCNGIDLCRLMLQQHPSLKVIAFSNFDDSQTVRKIMDNGASGYLLKNTDQQVLLNAIRKVNEGQVYVDAAVNCTLPQPPAPGLRRSVSEIPLTKRERDILKLISQGYSTQKIAEQFSLNQRSVELQYQQISQKLGATSAAALIAEGVKRGLIE